MLYYELIVDVQYNLPYYIRNNTYLTGGTVMQDWNYVRAKVISVKGSCPSGHKLGDEWIIGRKSPDGLCIGALENILPYVRILAYGGVFPWASGDLDIGTFSCPGDNNPVTFELRRLHEKA